MSMLEAKVTVGNDHTPSEDTVSRANALKDEGNKLLQDKKFEKASDLYTQAIEMCPTAILYSNRALAAIKQESYGLAIADAESAIGLDPAYTKAYYRRGSANYALGKYKLALKDFKHVVRTHPKDREAIQKMKECEKAVRVQAFAEAIETEHNKPLSETLDVDSIAVESTYDGPHMPENGQLTVEFLDQLIERFKDQKLLHRKYVVKILLAALKIFQASPNMIPIETKDIPSGSITVCGDTHGQFFDVLRIFDLNGRPSASNPYVFNGDFVDRGSFSFEVVFTFLAYKVAYPTGIHLVRGNHESKNMNRIYGFEGEVKAKYDDVVMTLFSEVFCALPLCALINRKIFIVHGGLAGEDGVKLEDINKVDRFREPPEGGLMSDLLWADPQPLPGRAPSKRGVGLSFGPDVTKRFLDDNDLKMVIRSHEVKQEGYQVEHDGKCITVFSAPNYCDQMGNRGAFIKFSEDLEPRFTQFEAAPHPPIRPMAYASNLMGL